MQDDTPAAPDATPDAPDAAPVDDQPAAEDTDWADQMANLQSMDDQQLSDLELSVLAAFQAADDANDLDTMEQTAAALDTIRDEVSSRGGTDDPEDPDGDGDTDIAGASDDADAPIVADGAAVVSAEPGPPALPAPTEPAEPVATDPAADAPPAAGTPPPDPVTADAPAPTEPQQPASAPTTEEAPVAEPEIPADRAPVPTDAPATQIAIVAGADIPQYSAGTEFNNLKDVGQAFLNRMRGIRDARGSDGDHLTVATITASVADDSRVLLPDDPKGNTEKIRLLTDMKAITASGGFCAPLEVNYNIFGLGVTDRPVKDALAGFQADRGGIRYVAPPILSSMANAVSLWTAANDANPTSPTTKPCLTVQCQPEQTALVDAVTLCLQFGNLVTRAFPELVNRNNELALIQQARFAEINLLTKLTSLSTAVSSTKVYGTALDSLQALAKVASGYRMRNRMNVNDVLRVIAPAPLLDAIREDYSVRTGVEDLAVTDAVIGNWLAARKINISWTIDEGLLGPQNAGPINDFPSSFRFWLYAEGTFLFLDGGTLDIGLVRDSALVGTNDYKMFTENFEQVAKVGIEGIVATVNTGVTGLTGGFAHAGATP